MATNPIVLDVQAEAAEFAAIEAEAIGWQPLGDGAYLHRGNADEEAVIITVVGIPDLTQAGQAVLLLA